MRLVEQLRFNLLVLENNNGAYVHFTTSLLVESSIKDRIQVIYDVAESTIARILANEAEDPDNIHIICKPLLYEVK